MDSFEDFDSHWSCQKKFGRPKPKLASVTYFQNPILTKYMYSTAHWNPLGASHFRKYFGIWNKKKLGD